MSFTIKNMRRVNTIGWICGSILIASINLTCTSWTSFNFGVTIVPIVSSSSSGPSFLSNKGEEYQ